MVRRAAKVPSEQIVKRYDAAKQRDDTMTPKRFLDIVAPSKRGGRSESSARRYLAKLRTGERSGVLLYKYATADSGKLVNVAWKVGSYVDAQGNTQPDIRSANIWIPIGRTRFDVIGSPKLRSTTNRYLRNSYNRRRDHRFPVRAHYEPIRTLPRNAQLAEIKRIRNTKYPTEVLR